MKPLFITATNTNVGKTYASLQLIEKLSCRGIRVGVCKPIETGIKDVPLDAQALLDGVQKYNHQFSSLTPEDITAFTFNLPAAPYCADTNHTISVDKIKEKIDELSRKCDLLIIEGAGGLLVPITESYYMIDLISELNALTLLVTPSRLGCINETLLSMEALKSRDIEFDWCVNLHEDKESFSRVTQPFYDTTFPEWWSLQDGLDNFIDSILLDDMK